MSGFLANKAKSLREKINNIIIAYVFIMIWLCFVRSFYNYLFEKGQIQWFTTYSHQTLINIFYTLLMAPVFEELLFRHFPIQVIKATKKKKLFLPTIIAVSIVFGLLHGDSSNILVQGMLGFVCSILYIKNGWSYWSAVSLHFLYNFGLLFHLYNF